MNNQVGGYQGLDDDSDSEINSKDDIESDILSEDMDQDNIPNNLIGYYNKDVSLLS